MIPDSDSGRRPFSLHSRFKSFAFAFTGLRNLVRAEHNARIHLAATLAAVTAGVVLRIGWSDWRWIVLAIAIVWLAEAFNTAIEALCDVISPGFNDSIRSAKDVAAGGVLVASIAALVIGVLTFLPYLLFVI